MTRAHIVIFTSLRSRFAAIYQLFASQHRHSYALAQESCYLTSKSTSQILAETTT